MKLIDFSKNLFKTPIVQRRKQFAQVSRMLVSHSTNLLKTRPLNVKTALPRKRAGRELETAKSRAFSRYNKFM